MKRNDGSSLKIAFMHIPKTAGVSVIDAFTSRLGSDACRSFSETITDQDFVEKTFVSGHVYLGDITECCAVFTIVREPLQQIASHLMWIDHYNMPEYEQEAATLPQPIRKGIADLKSADLCSAIEIDRYLQETSYNPMLRIANLQSEMIAFRRGQVLSVSDDELAEKAISNLGRFQLIGTVDRMSFVVSRLFEGFELGSAPPIKTLNKSPSRRKIDLADVSIREVLCKFVGADLKLYDYIAGIGTV